MRLLFNLLKRKAKKVTQAAYWQQGDELFHQVAELPKERKKRVSGIIIKSPVTGHAHRVVKGSLLISSDGKLFIRGPAKVVHEEHKDILLPKGAYEVKTVQEFDHLTEESRNVID